MKTYTYNQILDKIKKFRKDSGLDNFCKLCGYPCLVDYEEGGYVRSEESLYSIMDTCEQFKEYIMSKVPDLFEKYVMFEINIRKKMYTYNIFEQNKAGEVNTNKFTYPASEVDTIYNDQNALTLKMVIDDIKDVDKLRKVIGKNIRSILTKEKFIGSPNENKECLLEFYTTKFKLINKSIGDDFVYDLMRKATGRFVHGFIPGKKRLNLKDFSTIYFSVPIEYDNYFNINQDMEYKLLVLDGIATRDKIIENVKKGRNRAIVFDAFFADVVLDNKNNIYYKFDLSNKNYLVKIKDIYFTSVRQWIVFDVKNLNLSTVKKVGKETLKCLDVVETPTFWNERPTEKQLFLDLETFIKFFNWTDKLNLAIYGIVKSGMVIGVKDKEPVLRFLLRDEI